MVRPVGPGGDWLRPKSCCSQPPEVGGRFVTPGPGVLGWVFGWPPPRGQRRAAANRKQVCGSSPRPRHLRPVILAKPDGLRQAVGVVHDLRPKAALARVPHHHQLVTVAGLLRPRREARGPVEAERPRTVARHPAPAHSRDRLVPADDRPAPQGSLWARSGDEHGFRQGQGRHVSHGPDIARSGADPQDRAQTRR